MDKKKILENMEVKLLMLRKRLGQADEQVNFALEDARKLLKTLEEGK